MEAMTGWLSDDEQAAWRGLLQMTAHLNAWLNRELQEGHGLSLADYEVLVRLSDTAAALHPRKVMGQPALFPLQLLRELVDPQPRLGRVAEPHEHLVVGEGQAVALLQLPVEPGVEVRGHLQQAAPGRRLVVAEPSGHGVHGTRELMTRHVGSMIRHPPSPSTGALDDRHHDHHRPGPDRPDRHLHPRTRAHPDRIRRPARDGD